MNDILLLLLVSSVITDLHQGKIYNMLVFSAMSAGILQRLQIQGTEALPSLGLSVGLPLLLLPFWFAGHGIGGGDIKLLMAVSSLLEPVIFIESLGITLVTSGILALVLLLAVRDRKAVLPMSFPIAAGTIATLLQEKIAGGSILSL